MIIKSLQSQPEIFEPIFFKSGINIITGEGSITDNNKLSKKTNGVGKTLLLAFIDFCFLSDYKKNKIRKVQETIMSKRTKI